MKKLFTTLTVIIVLTSMTFGQQLTVDNTEYKETLGKMFKLSGTEETYQVAITQMFAIYKQQYTSVSDETWNELETEFKNTSMNDLVELLVPVYQKHFSVEDIRELIKFYESPIGQKLAVKTPLITQESMQVGQQWGMKIGQDFVKKMKEKGY
tara:strand:+ start:283 stop:741 length:459 start_codon:yes stop_codon:yes gene_type:complete